MICCPTNSLFNCYALTFDSSINFNIFSIEGIQAMVKKHIVVVSLAAIIYLVALTHTLHSHHMHASQQVKVRSGEALSDALETGDQREGQGVRLLTYSETYSFSNYMMLGCEVFFSSFRNLILIALCCNMLETVLPLVILCESFLMMGLLDTQMYNVATFYYNVFNSKMDLFNTLRLMIAPGPDSDTLSQLSQYGFSSNVLFNISAELLVGVVFLLIVILIKVGSIFCNS